MAEKKPAILKGKLEAFFETGSEGVIWSFLEDGKDHYHYEGIHFLKSGDFIRVFNDAAEKKVCFEGTVDLEYKNCYRPYPMNPQYGQQEVLGYWVRGLQNGEDPEAWATMFFEEKRAELISHAPPSP